MISENYNKIKSSLPKEVTFVVVSKTQSAENIMEVYDAEHRAFGENKVQEMEEKFHLLPKDIQWHLIGHLQTNKVKLIAPFVHLIHSVDSLKLLQEINKQALKYNRTIDCLLQIYIADEVTKFGLTPEEAEHLIRSKEFSELKNISIIGVMGMATNTANKEQIKNEFHSLKTFFDKIKTIETSNLKLLTLSMGMTSDYALAVEQGSTMVRIGSAVFGERIYV